MNYDYLTNRAWCEIDLNNLSHNIKEIEKIISKDTKIMAVLKANAYGHDLVIIAKKLMEMGITDFAVASLDEAIILRENNIVGNILILGYTKLENISYIIKYDLIQTVVSEDYALKLKDLKDAQNIKVHLKINTGMNRIGINYQNIDFIKKLCLEKKLNILGIYSHLCVSNSNNKNDKKFTKLQIDRFNNVLKELEKVNIHLKSHLQSSYGLLNYSEYKYEYVRIGILMYGNYNDNLTYHKIKLELKPVLTLKARVTSIIEIQKGETVGYGRCYKAKRKEKIASVSIGYVDGIPKSLENKNIVFLLNKHYAKLVGKICMDQLMINVTDIPNVCEGDIVTLIGKEKYIRAEYLSTKLKTISPELFGRLGKRLKYISKN